MNAALHKIQRDLHRCNDSLRKSARNDRHQFRVDRDRKHRTRLDWHWTAQQIRSES